LEEETGVSGENHGTVASHRQTSLLQRISIMVSRYLWRINHT